MLDIESLKEEKKVSEFTIAMKWMDAETLKNNGEVWQIRSSNAKEVRQAKRARDLKLIEMSQTGSLDDIEAMDLDIPVYAAFVAGWSGMKGLGGKEIPFNQETLLVILNHSMYGPHTQSQIDRTAGNTAAFFAAAKKNLKN